MPAVMLNQETGVRYADGDPSGLVPYGRISEPEVMTADIASRVDPACVARPHVTDRWMPGVPPSPIQSLGSGRRNAGRTSCRLTPIPAKPDAVRRPVDTLQSDALCRATAPGQLRNEQPDHRELPPGHHRAGLRRFAHSRGGS